MVSEGVQTNGFSRTSSQNGQSPPQPTPPIQAVQPKPQVRPPQQPRLPQQPPLPPYQDPPPVVQKKPVKPQSAHSAQKHDSPKRKRQPPPQASPGSPTRQIPPHIASKLPGYQLQVYHIDGDNAHAGQKPPAGWVATAPRSGKHQHHHAHAGHQGGGHKHSHHKAARSHSSGNVLESGAPSSGHPGGVQDQQQTKKLHKELMAKHRQKEKQQQFQKSHSDGELLDEDGMPIQGSGSGSAGSRDSNKKAVKFVQPPMTSAVSGTAFCPPSEEEVSDRDLPELAPITQKEYQQACLAQQHSQQRSQDTAASTSSNLDDDLEKDLGQALSPLGSTSSLQDLIESSSARASEDVDIKRTSTWLERERQQQKEAEAEIVEAARPPVAPPVLSSEVDGNKKSKSGKSVIVVEPELSEDDHPEEQNGKAGGFLEERLNIRMDSVNSAKTNETSTTATSDDYLTAPEQVATKSSTTTTEDEVGDDEEIIAEEYLESPEKEVHQHQQQHQEPYSTSGMVINSTASAGLEAKQQEVRSPTHSMESSSSGSYSVNNTHTDNGGLKKLSEPVKVEQQPEVIKEEATPEPEIVHQPQNRLSPAAEPERREEEEIIEAAEAEASPSLEAMEKTSEMTLTEPKVVEQASVLSPEAEVQKEAEMGAMDIEAAAAETQPTKRKQELTLDLDLNAPPQMVHQNLSPTPTEEATSESSMIWQRLPMGTGEVSKKRQAFEKQIKAMSVDEGQQDQQQQPKKQNGGAYHKVARKIVSEEAASNSPGMARSPAMHAGFRNEEWVVERTPVTTPDADKVVVAMINLSDEETSNHLDSDVVFKSSTAATTPQDGSLMSSLGPSSVDLAQEQQQEGGGQHLQTASASAPSHLADSCHPPPKEEVLEDEVIKKTDEVQEETKEPEAGKQPEQPPPAKKLPLVDPPAGFGDSPEHRRRLQEQQEEEQRRLRQEQHEQEQELQVHEAVADQPLPQDEQLVMASEETDAAPRLHITESFQPSPSEVMFTQKKEYFQEPEAVRHHHSLERHVQHSGDQRQHQHHHRHHHHKHLEEEQQPLQQPAKPISKASSATSVATPHSRPSTAASKNNRSRSRSSSKERLLSTLAGSENAPQTAPEEDEISGKVLSSFYSIFSLFLKFKASRELRYLALRK